MCTPEQLIKAIRESFIGAEQVYTFGSCVMFYRILKTLYPDAQPYWSTKARHMITRIGKKFYDITGEVKYTADYSPDDTTEYTSIPVAVAFPQRTERRHRFTTPQKL